MWRRVLFLLCIQIGFAVELTQSRAQPVLTAASAPILSSCASTDDSSIQSICRMCPASTAYTISPDQLASLRGTFDDRTELLLLAVMNDLGLHLSAANYTITDSGERLCIAVSEFTRKPNANDLFQYFAGMPRATLAIPEIFSLKNTIDFRYMAVSVVYIDQQLVYDEVDFVFDGC